MTDHLFWQASYSVMFPSIEMLQVKLEYNFWIYSFEARNKADSKLSVILVTLLGKPNAPQHQNLM